MTLQILAQMVGTTAQTIQRLETGNMTVSLDWLQRIANAFDVPAAALIVSETTASVPVLGTVDAAGEVTLADPAAPEARLSLVIAAPSPIAVRVIELFGIFEAGTILIGDKTDFDPDFLTEKRDCLVAFKSGRIVFRRVTMGEGGIVLDSHQTIRIDDGRGETIDWIAPIQMAIRYF